MLKRLFDIGFIVVMSPLLLAVGVVTAAAVAAERTGPIFYRGTRIGRGGRRFLMWKFRSMHVDGDSRLTPEMRERFRRDFKLDDDPRLTRIGRWLRRSSLDELPQIINVITGDMSLVGPRPKLPDELGLYGSNVDLLLSVRPGMTGQWQVMRRSCASDETMRRMDLEYAGRCSLALDIRILLRTPWVMLTGRNT